MWISGKKEETAIIKEGSPAVSHQTLQAGHRKDFYLSVDKNSSKSKSLFLRGMKGRELNSFLRID